MEEEKGEGVSSARASSSLPPSAPPFPSSHPPMEAKAAAAPADQRQRFAVELRPGETTIVSWKRLMKDSTKGSGSSQPAPAGAHPALESRISPPAIEPVECEPKDDEPPPNRFSAVIEKIERLYMGNQSSDEEEFDEVPDDDQYDTEDSFIDDAELDEYFQVDKLATKHNGFFVNRGNLERIEPNSSLTVAPKKRRRKESTKNMSEKDIQQMPIELGSKGNVRMKAAARNAPLVGKKSSPSRSLTPFGDKYLEGKFSKNMVNSSTMTCQKKSTDTAITSESLPSARMPNLDVLALPVEPKYLEKQKVGVIQSRDLGNRLRGASDSVDAMQQASRDKGVSSQTDSQPRKLLNDEKEIELPTKIRRREKNEPSELPDLNSPGSIYPVQPVKPSSRLKEVSGIRPKGTTLERAIRDLEKMVLVSRPPSLDVQETDTSQGVKKRLPREVKQKLAKVARLAASTGKIPEEELLDRLMGILGHLLQRKTLKRNLKEMIQQGFAAKKLKANRLEHVKKEVIEMIRTRIVPLKAKVAEQQDGSSDDFQDAFITEERRVLKAKCNMDDAIEDKICDLYDLYVEGMDEDLGPQIRKLYVELAELWPNGYMDNLGIKDAVYRAKERKRALYKQQKDHHRERIKRKRLHNYTVKIEETASLSAETRAGQDRPAIDSSGQFLMPAEKVTSNHQSVSLSSKASDHSASLNGSGHLHRLKHQDKVRRGISSSNRIADEGYKTASSLKKLKRKSEVDMGEIHANPMKLHSIHSKEKEKHTAHKHSANPSAVVDHKPSLQSHGFQGSDRPS